MPQELQIAIEWQRDKYRRYRDGERLPDITEGQSNPRDAEEAHSRNLTTRDLYWLQDLLQTHGLHVVLEIDPLPTNESVYEKPTKYWEQEGDNWTEKDKPLLQIHIKKGSHFVEYSGREFSKEEAPFDYHISLCFTNELHRFDLYRSENGVELGKAAYTRLRDKYNGREIMLQGHMQKTAFYIDPDSAILNDRDLIMLHNAGSYADRTHHISMRNLQAPAKVKQQVLEHPVQHQPQCKAHYP
jgi:hypothetical protein